jgi:hypothetical protein
MQTVYTYVKATISALCPSPSPPCPLLLHRLRSTTMPPYIPHKSQRDRPTVPSPSASRQHVPNACNKHAVAGGLILFLKIDVRASFKELLCDGRMPLIGREVERPATLVTQSPQGTVSSVFGLGRTFDPEMGRDTETQRHRHGGDNKKDQKKRKAGGSTRKTKAEREGQNHRNRESVKRSSKDRNATDQDCVCVMCVCVCTRACERLRLPFSSNSKSCQRKQT